MQPRDLAARFTALSPALRRAWEAEPRPHADHAAHALFLLLTREVLRLLRAGEHATLPALFAEVERTLSDAPEFTDAATTGFLEHIAGPELYVHALPWLGPRSLAFLRAWESGAKVPFLSPARAESLLLAPLGAASPAFARGWSRAAPHVSAADGTTTAHGVADFAFEVARTTLERGDHTDLAALLAAIDPQLAPSARPLARAFERSFLERLRELSLDRLDIVRPLLGPRARTYWDVHLALGEPRFGVWDERPSPDGARLLPATTLRRDDAWGWLVAVPRGDLGRTLHEVLKHDGRIAGEDDTALDDTCVRGRWTWSDDDPSGDYTLELGLDDRPLARFAFTLP